jgi:hypothetical protein
MYSRVIYENWSYIVPVLAFAFTLVFYSVMVIRAFLLKKERTEQMASLPLED